MLIVLSKFLSLQRKDMTPSRSLSEEMRETSLSPERAGTSQWHQPPFHDLMAPSVALGSLV